MSEQLEQKALAAKQASKKLAFIETAIKNQALSNLAADLLSRQSEILAANDLDYKEAQSSGMNAAMLDRLLLNSARLEAMSNDVLAIAKLADPVGELFDERTLSNGLQLARKRVPLGVIGCIYESRPNVTIDISSLCLKSGNAVILRGGKETIRSNRALVKVVQEAAYRAGIPQGAVQFIDDTDHSLVEQMLKLNKYIDLIIPRGGAGLIKFVSETASMPVGNRRYRCLPYLRG
jgi:glutamate-5-semialdehyde dehydrogenase